LLKEAHLQYNINFDQTAYHTLLKQEGQIPPSEFAQKLINLNALVRHNVETAIGERYNVELFQETYQLFGNEIFSESFAEPFLEVVKRGQRFRKAIGSNDLEREAADVEGFKKIQTLLVENNLPNFKVIIISPKGPRSSIYQHNYFDVYEKLTSGQIRMSRLTCKFSYEDFAQAAKAVDKTITLPENPTDADFLASPATTTKSIAEIKQIFHPQQETTPTGEYRKLLEACAPLISIYLNNICQENYYAILNFADIYMNKHHVINNQSHRQEIIRMVKREENLAQTAAMLGSLAVREVKTGCGISAGANSNSGLSILNPFSVADFGMKITASMEDQYGTLEIHCDECNRTYMRQPGKLEAKCRLCGGTKGIVC